jgi:cytochrome c oxidase subunit 2
MLANCAGSFSMIAQATSALSPATPQAQAISRLLIAVIVMASAIAALVTGLVVWAMVRYRDRGGPAPVQSEGKKSIEIAYTVIPLAMMIALFVGTVATMGLAEPQPAKTPTLVIIAHQWWWEVRYPDAHVVTANEIHLPAGVAMQLALESGDVIHELWIPQLGPKMDAVPGQTNRMVLEGTTLGTYLGFCAEFCGACHAQMRCRVIVESPQDFAVWEASQQQLPVGVSGEAEQGRALFLSSSCMQCHAVEGTAAVGSAGPDLTHFASRGILAAGALENTPENLRRWLADPQAIKPGCHMPNMKLSTPQIEEVARYLESLK